MFSVAVTFVTANSDDAVISMVYRDKRYTLVITQGFNALYVATGVTPEPGQRPPHLCVLS